MAKNIANINIDKNIDKKSTQNIDKSAKKGGPLFFWVLIWALFLVCSI